MNRVLLMVMLFFMCFQGAWAQLPPDVQADRHLMSAMMFIESEEYESAIKEFESILKLNIKVPNDFYFHYGKTLIQNRNLETGKQMIEKFIGLAGRSSEMYKPSLELLAQIESQIEKARKSEADRIMKLSDSDLLKALMNDREIVDASLDLYSDRIMKLSGSDSFKALMNDREIMDAISREDYDYLMKHPKMKRMMDELEN